MTTSKVAKLTRREREIIVLVAEGLRNKEIAGRLFISSTTVRHHLSAVFAKLEVPDRLKLMVFAFRHGLADLFREEMKIGSFVRCTLASSRCIVRDSNVYSGWFRVPCELPRKPLSSHRS